MTETPDAVVPSPAPDHCRNCGDDLAHGEDMGKEVRQVFDVPRPETSCAPRRGQEPSSSARRCFTASGQLERRCTLPAAADVADRFGYSPATVHQLAAELLRRAEPVLPLLQAGAAHSPQSRADPHPGAAATGRGPLGNRDRREHQSRRRPRLGPDGLGHPARRGLRAPAPGGASPVLSHARSRSKQGRSLTCAIRCTWWAADPQV
jgi:hypothetical protein